MKFALLAGLLVCAHAALLQAPRPLSGWDVIGHPEAGKEISVIFSLKTSDRTTRRLEETSNPDSSEFRKWATRDEALALLDIASPDAVLAWLRAGGVKGDVVAHTVQARMSIAQAEHLFATEFVNVKDASNGQVWHHAGAVHAPENVTSVVSAVYGVHGLPLPPKKQRKANAMVNVGPTEIRKAYKVTGRGSGNLKVRQAVAEFQGQFSNAQDLQSFFQNLVPNAQPGDDTVYAYKGNKGSGYGIEALLDIQYIMGIAPGIKTEFWGWRNFDFCQDLKSWVTTIIADSNPPVVFSVSYGWQGDLSQIGCTTSEVQDVDKDFRTIANRGISIIFASGDSGSAYDGTQCWASWPASSPFVTAVGATCFTDQSMTTEMASTQFGSGSGFSGMFPVGQFQASAVSSYLSAQGSNLPPSGVWHRAGRASADVSALGEGYQVYVNGQVEIVGGTSASTPCFAAIISLLNDKEVAKGSKTLGYLNPWVYKNVNYFTDITRGSDKIGRGGQQLQYGFDCAAGWDPATGLGTPKFDQMMSA